MQISKDYLDFYRTQSEISSPGKYAYLYDDLPTDVRALCRVIQGFLIHQFWILKESNYGISATTLKAAGRNLNDEINLRTVEQMFERVLVLADQPLTQPREAKLRLVGNCRDYALFLVSMLRHQGIPARVRSGVARYFFPHEVRLEDHFICEWWNAAENRWQRTDPQIDDLQHRVLGMAFDPVDLPPNQFLNAAESYRELKEGRVQPGKIGIFDYSGWKYVRYKLVSDLASVNSVEVLAWEGWGVCNEFDTDSITGANQALVEEITALLEGMDTEPGFSKVRRLFQSDSRLQFPPGYQPQYWELPAFK